MPSPFFLGRFDAGDGFGEPGAGGERWQGARDRFAYEAGLFGEANQQCYSLCLWMMNN